MDQPPPSPDPKPQPPPQWTPPLDELTDDLQSMSFNSTTTTTAPRSTSSSSETTTTTWTTASSSHHNPQPSLSLSSDPWWSAVKSLPSLSFSDLRFLSRLGSGDIGAVYLSEIKDNDSIHFAAKVMDNRELAARNKHGRARAEREILQMLDHPFLPTLYASLDSPKWSCLLTEFCNGGDLHVLRQRQPFKRFEDSAVRFYASEVVVALEYIHMMGIVYRDLKPENVLVRSDGHIMLTDFDLSLKCDEQSTPTPQIITSSSNQNSQQSNQNPNLLGTGRDPSSNSSSCIIPSCIVPSVSCFNPNWKKKWKTKRKPGRRFEPEFCAEPVDVRSMSFVGTHEYLAPEIVSGEGHGSAVDWWTLGIFIFELFYGTTPFKGSDNEMTLANIVARALEFPKEPSIPSSAKDLISQLLAKDPTRRLGSVMGATPIKQHPFFSNVNWALLRCMKPPYVPPPFSVCSGGCREVASDDSCPDTPVEYY
ncbi:serine/threonine-protein kinase D6PKL2-like [Chenopodium quinoa]|nr:serine/threonine-protein kinase D6PKL2-like [Chenopodium quinoa]